MGTEYRLDELARQASIVTISSRLVASLPSNPSPRAKMHSSRKSAASFGRRLGPSRAGRPAAAAAKISKPRATASGAGTTPGQASSASARVKASLSQNNAASLGEQPL